MATVILRPNGAGASTNIPGQYPGSGFHYDKVDDVSPSSADYVYYDLDETGYSATLMDTYALPNLALSSVIINSVTVYASCAWVQTGGTVATWWGTVIRTHDTDYGANKPLVAGSYELLSTEYTTNPYTNEAWTVDEVNALEAGVRFRVYYSGDYMRCRQVYVVVDYHHSTTVAMDMLLKATDTKTVAMDMLLRETDTETISIDTLLRDIDSKTVSVDTLIKATDSTTVDVDTLLRATDSTSVDLDTLIKAIDIQQISVDTLIQGTDSKTVSIDTLIGKLQSTAVLTVDHTKFTTDRYNVPITIDQSWTAIKEFLNCDYKKIKIYDESENLCWIEKVEWDAVNERVEIVFKAPYLSSSVDTKFYILGHPEDEDNPYIGEYGTDAAKEVWS